MAVRPVGGDQIGVVVGHDLVVGRDDPAARRVEALGQLVEGDLAEPVVRAGPSLDGKAAVAAWAQGHTGRRHESDGALAVGVEQGLLRAVEVPQGLPKLCPIARPVHGIDCVCGTVVGPQGWPGQRQGPVLAERRGAAGAQVRDHRAVAGAAHGDGHGFAAAHLDDLLAQLEGPRAVGRVVAVGRAGGPALDEQVLGVAVGRREGPGDVLVVPGDQEGHARRGGARQGELRRLDTGQVPLARLIERQMEIVGQDRQAIGGLRSGDNPGVGGILGRPAPRQDIARQDRWRASPGGPAKVGGRQVAEGVGGVRRVGAPEEVDLLGGEALGEAQAQRLARPVAGELQRHEAAPDQAVRRAPGLGLDAEDLKFDR